MYLVTNQIIEMHRNELRLTERLVRRTDQLT